LLDVYTRKWRNEYQRSWEQARFIAYVIAQVNSKKKIAPSDIMKFSWDNNKNVTAPLSAEQRREMEALMKQVEKELNNDR
jgi:hypothetical protein